jgi:hypothetical protein
VSEDNGEESDAECLAFTLRVMMSGSEGLQFVAKFAVE